MPKIERAVLKNPYRVDHPTQMTDIELEVERMAEEGTPQTRTAYAPLVYEYWAPFNYPNFCVELGRTDPYVGAEFNSDGVELDVPPYGAITFQEDKPITAVTVIGSACVPPGFVLLFAEPLQWKYPRSGVKMRADNLWGKHIRIEPWLKGVDEGYLDAGLSCALFEIPESNKITIMAGSQMIMDEDDFRDGRHDAHYCIRIIRVTVKAPAPAV